MQKRCSLHRKPLSARGSRAAADVAFSAGSTNAPAGTTMVGTVMLPLLAPNSSKASISGTKDCCASADSTTLTVPLPSASAHAASTSVTLKAARREVSAATPRRRQHTRGKAVDRERKSRRIQAPRAGAEHELERILGEKVGHCGAECE